MMTLEEIRSAQINPTAAREAYNHADRQLMDTLETKKFFEQKAFTLFGAYVTAATALFGIGAALLKDNYWNYLSTPFFVSVSVFVVGAIFFVLALMDKTYGALASDPDMWLKSGTIDGDDSVVPLMLAYITYYHKERISKSTDANNSKAAKIRLGIYCGVCAPLIMFIATLI